ncbi:3-hydroxy-3-methylglutaryl-coenzyme A reductase-like [Penaeus monodon]|uniref:3-hydroxy-3-methylglutaryl-coenzyme A reductase-like n=1 Tax=Penaeus monodon TaxID=6687 RepID=UPI0018A7A445|nr:3-hydroxy-3-methylglutaryl-coenzyme A reductase-like [Penaeus monodon]
MTDKEMARGGVAWRAFWSHGRLCAARPWEVIFSVITTTVAMISLADLYKAPRQPRTPQEYQGLDVVVMTILRCSALLYTYHQFRTLHRIGSKYIVGIAGLFAVFSSFVFCCSVIKLLDSDVSDLKDALFFFLLLVDLSKASLLAQFALSSSNQTEVHTNIACGMARLGPSLTLDTIVEALVIGAGTLSGVSRLEQMCAFACLSIIVNYVVFMTFFPACLSLVLELSNRCSSGQPPWQMATLARAMVEEEKPNPVVQRVKVIMSAGLLLVHGITRWSLSLTDSSSSTQDVPQSFNSSTDPHIIVRLLNAGLDHIVFMVMLVALIIKYVLFESQGQLEESLIHDSLITPQDTLDNSRINNKGGLNTSGILRQRTRSRTTSCNSQWEEIPPKKTDCGSQTDKEAMILRGYCLEKEDEKPPRSIDECLLIMNSEAGVRSLTDQEIVQMVEKKHVPGYKLETVLGDPLRAVAIRRSVVAPHTASQNSLETLPFDHYDYTKVMGVCCENVIGYVPVPVGVAGPLLVNGKKYMIPMATTEGCLVASTNRGCRALVGGVKSEVIRDGMTRAPSVRMPTAAQATQVYKWIRKKENFAIIKEGFDSTSRFARLQDLHVGLAGRLLYMRFVAQTGDAMGMNMVSKGTEAGLKALKNHFPELEVLSVSGNYCVDKKPSAINWIEGRGKSVVCEAVVPGKVVTSVLKTTVAALVEANVTKNLIGSSLAGSIGGNNAHAANIVAAVYIACGQDPAQVVGSSNCMTLMESWGEYNEDLHITVTMPSLEVGTVGGGTGLHPQSACLNMLGVKGQSVGAHKDTPGENSCQFAKILGATVLAGELSLMSALAAGHLVKSHLAHNRAKAEVPASSSSPTPTPAPASGTKVVEETKAGSEAAPSTESSRSQEGEKENGITGSVQACKDPADLSVPHSRER